MVKKKSRLEIRLPQIVKEYIRFLAERKKLTMTDVVINAVILYGGETMKNECT